MLLLKPLSMLHAFICLDFNCRLPKYFWVALTQQIRGINVRPPNLPLKNSRMPGLGIGFWQRADAECGLGADLAYYSSAVAYSVSSSSLNAME